MTLILWNSNSIRNKVQYLETIVHEYDPIFIVLTETHLDPQVSSNELKLPNYEIFRRDRPTKGGGILVAIKSLKGVQIFDSSVDPNEEMLVINLSVHGFRVCVVTYYRPPRSAKMSALFDFFEDSLVSNFVLLGDFNFPEIQWTLDTPAVSPGGRGLAENFLSFILKNNFSQHVNFPTHSKGNTLDLIFTNFDPCPIFKNADVGMSDHTALCFELFSFFPQVDPPVSRTTRTLFDFGKARMSDISEQTAHLYRHLQFIEASNTTDFLWNTFKYTILNIANSCIPVRKPKGKKFWLSREARTVCRKKRRFFHTYKAYPTSHNLEQLKSIGNLSKRLIKRDYNKFLESHITESLKNGDSKPLFQLISKSSKGGKCSNIMQLHNCVNDNDMAISFANNFKSVFTVDDGHVPQVSFTQSSAEHVPQMDIAVSEEGVLALLNNLNHRKGMGPDNLSPALLKFLAVDIAPILTLIFKHSLNTGGVPLDWKHANVVPVFKKGDKKAPLNYRPISLTSVSSKVIEHIIAHNIRDYLDQNNILSETQHGFRKKHSCESQLIHTISDLANFNNLNTQVDVLVLDFSKAFDTVSHDKLIHKLRSYGLNANVVTWIQHWLLDRTFCVIVNGKTSPPTQVTSGVPQGSVLGPLLFLLYINDLPESLNCPKTSIRLFADDAILFRPIECASDSLLLQDQLCRVAAWAESWQLRFNANKCTSTSVEPVRFSHIYNYCGTSLISSQSFLYLGILVSSTLNFNEHINRIIRKANGTLFMLMRTLKNTSPNVKRTAYYSVCRPLLEYASEIWSPHFDYSIQDLESINRKAFRWANNLRKFDSISSEMVKMGWQTLAERRRIKDESTLQKILSQDLMVDFNRFVIKNSSYFTRGSNIRHTINASAMKHSFFNRAMKF